jgi:ubiquinone/menaquinone biosynthesis C-methylase UbiE
MNIIFTIYRGVRRLFARKGEKGEYSSGYLPSKVRDKFIEICKEREGKILEIGCGEGLFVSGLRQVSKRLAIFGVDILREGLLRTKQRLNSQNLGVVHLTECDGQRLCFKDSAFDCVVCLNVLFNLPSFTHVENIIQEALRVAKPGAEVIVDIRNKKDLLTSLRYRFVKYYDNKCPVALNQYDEQEIIRVFKANNAQVQELILIKAIFGLTKPITIIQARKS